ncbi:hypothetical protein ATHL_02967, partial [Anaerolinea thermolimosa]|uniref:hypothetical protein n=1 Tax=Anaerolinea thermolimosa TaxID=229919 RepID=UPI0013B389D5
PCTPPASEVIAPQHDCNERGRPRRRPSKEQITDILKHIPGIHPEDFHKPKQRSGKKASDLCCDLPTADAILPLMVEIFDRFRAEDRPRAGFEEYVYAGLGKLDSQKLEALEAGFEGYRNLSPRLRDCLFSDHLARKIREDGVSPAEVIEAFIQEGLAYTGQVLFSHSKGVMGPGQVRMWDAVLPPTPNGSQQPRIFTGPWPWITAIRPDIGDYKEYGNRASYQTLFSTPPYTFQPYQIARDCQVSQNPNKPGELIARCVPQTPPPPPPGALFPSFCEGGEDYTYNGQCLQFPIVEPGATIGIRGFNFITSTVRVWFENKDTGLKISVDGAPVFGDLETPVKDEQGHVIHDWRVSDTVVVTLPNAHPNQPGAPLPPGLYTVTIEVDNILSAVYAGGVAPRLKTNALILQIEPDPNVHFHFWSEQGHCYEETDGLGSDEIWFDAWVAHLIPATTPTGKHTLQPVKHIEFDRAAWDDMDSGEDAGGYSADFWNGSFNRGFMVAGLIGFEVDSEAAARDQIRDFGSAFVHYLESIWSGALAAEGAAASIAKMISLTLTQGLIALAVIAAILLIVGLAWASWAPADRIAMDLITLNARAAWNLTSKNGQFPPVERYRFEEVTTSHNPRPKTTDTPSSVRYVTEHRYTTPEDGEDSDYGITFFLTRG